MSQIYSFPFKKTFAKAVLVELPKWYLEAHRVTMVKSKYLQLKTLKMLSERLLHAVLFHLTDLQLSPHKAVN